MEDLADVWPEGGLFAYSGVDGESFEGMPLVATGLKGAIGWQCALGSTPIVRAMAGQTPIIPWRSPGDFCFADCWRCTVHAGDDEGIVAGAFVTQASFGLLISFKELPDVCPDLVAADEGPTEGSVQVIRWAGWFLAIYREQASLRRKFGVAISCKNESQAVEWAASAAKAELAEVAQRRLGFYRSISVPEAISGNMRRAYYKAASIYKINMGNTLPVDSNLALRALGLQHLGMELSQKAIAGALAGCAKDDGGMPAQPPLLAWSVCRQSERVALTDFLLDVYPKLVGYLEWFERNRRNSNGLYGWRGDASAGFIESGMSGSPRFDNATALTAVDLSSYMASEYHSLEKIARCIDRVEEVGKWQKRRMEIVERVNALLWDDESRFYYDLDEHGEMVLVKSAAGFMPLLGQIPDRDRAEALRMHLMNPNEFWSGLPVPSVSQDEESFSADGWRGATWMSINALIYYGLMTYGFFQEARQLARVSVQEIARCYMKNGCFYDCYDPASAMSASNSPAPYEVTQDKPSTAAAFIYLTNEMN